MRLSASRGQRFAVTAVGMVVAASALAACSSKSSSKSPQVASNCAQGPSAVADGQPVVPLTSCAGYLGMSQPQPAITVTRGATITLRNLTTPNYTDPQSSAPSVVVVAQYRHGVAELRALRAGRATIALATPFCLTRTPQLCPALLVAVG